MATEQNNPLANLNLSGLNKLEAKADNKTLKSKFKAAASAETPAPVNLGVLETLIGTWVGPGFNLIEVPNMNQAKPGPPPADKFKIILNSTAETFTFSSIGGDIINRGNAQTDIAFMGLHYLQQVDDVNLPSGQNGIHLETGLFLNLPSGTDPLVQPSIARLGSIPHGDSLLAQGTFFTVNGGPKFEVADPTPFFIQNGVRVNDTSETYLSQLKNAVAPPGIPQEVIMNPNILLENAIAGQNITQTIVILLDANPIDGVANAGVTAPVGGITNIPFVNVNANANSLSAIFWIETVQNPDGTTFLQLQYTQTVILDFPVFAPDGSVVEIKWPHISVATLRLQE
ncbi:hypothetical protein GON26_02735 [Flavobacterium sp. GA093]|uniref:THAP4-like heme-binding beta-barrel domain-containing protein n=1 Tax=Flavobacterium hydrocarbonoxydans TaxID=2683249 RepID=A0A6I4NH40_9FLAO|nr:heme-binding protein [Flavobacterium hydrocarbonoxydans]MWB93263.1 hypothetical protein [Flavobacterium hydrocarbonoxydans]